MPLLSGSANIFLIPWTQWVYPPNNWVYVVGTWKQMAHCVWVMDLGGGAADTVCVVAWVSHQGRDTCSWASRRQKFSFVFAYFFFCCICLVQIQNTQTSAHRPFILSGSSCLASIELVKCGKAWFANQNHNRFCTSGKSGVWQLSKQLWMKYWGVGIDIFRLP